QISDVAASLGRMTCGLLPRAWGLCDSKGRPLLPV
ncbi:unnamed protein product, partial [Allacma fusca]